MKPGLSNLKTSPNTNLSSGIRKILFLCTGNYYRSRFAEILFNDIAKKENLKWKAFSRALKQSPTPGNVGPISINTLEYLTAKGIYSPQFHRYPKKVSRNDFEKADLTIAMKESEHRNYMISHFPDLEDKIEYWHIDDIDVASPEKVLPDLESRIMILIKDGLFSSEPGL